VTQRPSLTPNHQEQQMDWNLFGCARRGHVTHAPDELALRDRLMASTAAGTAWRCLHCGAASPSQPGHAKPANATVQSAGDKPRGRGATPAAP
jgi:hypothetical protein